MVFEKRTTAPSETNKFYIKAGKGGYNRAMEIDKKTHSCLPNCCGLVHGRWLESQKQTGYIKYDKLCTGNAHSYFKYDDGYKRGKTPKLGSIICFDKKGGYGHVAFVEDINSNGDILTSNSGYSGTRFFTKLLKKSNNYKYSNQYTLQGFIYPPVEFTKQYNLTRLLKLNCKGDDVGELQKELNVQQTKIFGPVTQREVIKFQKSKGLTQDGIVGKNTAHALGWLFRGE